MDNKFLVETSARHLHLTQEAFDFLEDVKAGQPHAQPVIRKMLSQPGMFVSDSRYDLIGPVDPKTGKPTTIKGVSFLGPFRDHNQVEISGTDARAMKINAPIRESGDVKGSAPISIFNPSTNKTLELKEGCIIAQRHIHMTPEDAKNFGVKNGDLVKALITGTGRETVFGDTVIRVSPSFHLDMHIDTDECNAAWAGGEVYGTLVK
jgi:putative phosphotransacetylase